jgi:ribosome-binding ATPase YchF (GTP1/OBG family)
VRLGLIGKTNTGKTTFFSSATLQVAEISNYPFTTKAPNVGVANAVTPCVHKELNVKDNPRNSSCIDGWRAIPIELIDLPGLIKGASMGKGLGNQFLSVAAQADVLLHIVDASGSVDAQGRITEPGEGNPLADIGDIEEELALWYFRLYENSEEKILRAKKSGTEFTVAVSDVFRGIGVKENHVRVALLQSRLEKKDPENWTREEVKSFCWVLRDVSKPTLIVANKMDLPTSAENFKKIRENYSDLIVVPASADAELTLRRAAEKNLIKYFPGEERFEIIERAALNEKQRWALQYIRKAIFGEYMRTGVQFALNVAVFKLLRMNSVYPVSDATKLSDNSGNILPDVYLMESGSTVEDLARTIHSQLAKGLLYAVDARNGLRLPADYELKDRDILSIVSTMKKSTGIR